MRSGTDIAFSCRCGVLTGTLCNARADEGSHLRCHCASCRRAMAHFDIPGDRETGVDVFQTTPDRIKITTGAAHLALMQLSPNGLYRWYAGCCGTPMFNTQKSPKLPFTGVLTYCLDDTTPLGPIWGEGFMEGPDGKTRHTGLPRMIWRFGKRTLVARLSGRWKDTPFFNKDGTPVAQATLAPR